MPPEVLNPELTDPRPPGSADAVVGSATAPWLSLIVPCYEMAPYLELTLEAIQELERGSPERFEVIVVDDGSSDGVAAVVANAARRSSHLMLRSVRRERDARSCRSLARNLGAAESRGRYLLFMDAGVMPHPKLLTLLAERLRAGTGTEEVLMIGTLGLFAAQLAKDVASTRERFRGLSAVTLTAAFNSLANHPAWCERRQPWFDLVQGDLSRLPAPWLFAWTAALGVPSHAFRAVSGFDEGITTWGAEDCDLGLRLHRAGVRFRALAAPAALHVPHPIDISAERHANHLGNLRRMNEKTFSREGELFVALEDPFAASLWALRLDRTPLERLLPSWDRASLLQAQQILGSQTDTLFVSAPTPQLAATFPGATWAVPNRALFDSVARALGVSSTKLSVACHGDEPTGTRECVVLTDLLRLLPSVLQIAQLKEATRVGKRTLLFCIEPATGLDESAIERDLLGFAFTSLTSLRALAESARVRLDPLASAAPRLRVYCVEAMRES